MVSQLFVLGGLVFIVMGLVHGLVSVIDVFRPTQFAPVDDAVRLAMKSTNVRFLQARANMWQAWLGFNLSPSLGMFIFGAVVVGLGLNLDLVKASSAALAMPAVIGFTYLILSLRFWFWAPTVAATIATACFVLAWLLY